MVIYHKAINILFIDIVQCYIENCRLYINRLLPLFLTVGYLFLDKHKAIEYFGEVTILWVYYLICLILLCYQYCSK